MTDKLRIALRLKKEITNINKKKKRRIKWNPAIDVWADHIYRGAYEATYWQTVDRLDVVCLISLLVIKETYSNLRVMQNFLDLTSAWWVV